MKTFQFSFSSILIVILSIVITACAPSEQTTRTGESPDISETDETTKETKQSDSEIRELLAANRSNLGDLQISSSHDMPESFLKRDTVDNNANRNPFDGFRVQIISDRNVAVADSVSKDFRLWADSTMIDYKPRPYVFFQQPFFKVHIGDFQDRQRARELSDLIKNKYPDAWVVHDRINPNLVPPDTARIDTVSADTTGMGDGFN